jgi:hypothetical protein
VLTLGIRFNDPATVLEEHDYYTRRWKKFGAVEPNLKMLLEDVLKRVHDDIQHSHDEILARFDAHTVIVDRRISEFAVEEQKRDDHVSNLESAQWRSTRRSMTRSPKSKI